MLGNPPTFDVLDTFCDVPSSGIDPSDAILATTVHCFYVTEMPLNPAAAQAQEIQRVSLDAVG
jgi:hypothetical protein